MAVITTITRNLARFVSNVFAWLFDNVFAWLWLSALLIVVAAFIILAPIKVVGEGGRNLPEVVASIGGILLVGAGVGWAWHRLGEEHQHLAKRLGRFLASLIVPVAIAGVAIRLWWSWDVPDIWNRPLATLTLGDITQNVLKLVVLFVGVSYISALFRALWRKVEGPTQ
jgi:hypothetical protein